ncbi:MAG: hypothetical protein PWP37_46 [Thermotogota bacterium]|nr:hypothetical protein [Thermotogota bacterium]MDK2863854.1 hypothetical protein [Thermotogota bacterium]HCZ07122.1 YicC family protein [Thermotogota bacterium]
MLSMTGYVKLKEVKDSLIVDVELKSLNSKGLNLSVSINPELPRLAFEVHRLLTTKLSRGSISCRIRLGFLQPSSVIKLDKGLAGAVIKGLRDLSDEFGIPDMTTTDTLSRFKDIFFVDVEEEVWEVVWTAVQESLEKAVTALHTERKKEGERLKKHIGSLLEQLKEAVEEIETLAAKQKEFTKSRLEKNVEELLRGSGFEPDRNTIETEIAVAASRCDIEEEIVRLRSHIKRSEELLMLEEPVGNRLDFLCQEMLRELNTIASKSVLKEISHNVVESKWLVTQLREQVQNVL